MVVFIRKLKQNEVSNILELGRQIFREEDEIPLLRSAISKCSFDLSLVAVDDNNILGFTLVCKNPVKYYFDFLRCIPNSVEIAFLGISPLSQGKGIGKRLLNETLMGIFHQSRYKSCWLLVDIDNYSAISLYEKCGFRTWAETNHQITPVPGYIMGIK